MSPMLMRTRREHGELAVAPLLRDVVDVGVALDEGPAE